MVEFGLIGKSLSHSFSKKYFEEKFKHFGLNEHVFLNFELQQIEEFLPLVHSHKNLKGLSVTMPYKESIIPFLDELSEEAKQIGAVNCVQFYNQKIIGHNTDAYGFSQSIKPFLDYNHERALVLGTGGASKAIAFVLKKIGLEVFYVTSSKTKKTNNTFFYDEINERVVNAFKLIVNTSPVGTTPNINECPVLPFEFISAQHLFYDLIYNPNETLFLKKAREKGAIVVNGFSMLQLQAEKSWEIWNKD